MAGALARSASTGPTAAIAGAAALSGEFAGLPQALAIPDLGGGYGPPGGPQADAVLARLYRDGGSDVAAAGRVALASMRTLDARLSRDAQGKIVAYQPEHGPGYDAAGDLGRALKVVAQLARMEVGLRVATVDIGGWDTHENQPGRFQNAIERLSGGLAAFWEDMARFHDRTIVVTTTEFGRRLRSNRSNGTDHGRGGLMAVLGGTVRGGRILGAWPGLASAKLDEGVDLAVATDYRRVLAEILQADGTGAKPGEIFPGYKYPGPLGVLAGSIAAGPAKG